MNSMGSFEYGKMSQKHVKIVNENRFHAYQDDAFASHAKRRIIIRRLGPLAIRTDVQTRTDKGEPEQ